MSFYSLIIVDIYLLHCPTSLIQCRQLVKLDRWPRRTMVFQYKSMCKEEAGNSIHCVYYQHLGRLSPTHLTLRVCNTTWNREHTLIIVYVARWNSGHRGGQACVPSHTGTPVHAQGICMYHMLEVRGVKRWGHMSMKFQHHLLKSFLKMAAGTEQQPVTYDFLCHYA